MSTVGQSDHQFRVLLIYTDVTAGPRGEIKGSKENSGLRFSLRETWELPIGEKIFVQQAIQLLRSIDRPQSITF